MKFGDLIETATDMIKGYNPVTMTVDSHADDFLSGLKNQYEKVFLKQVFYGCVRYEEFFKVFCRAFFAENSSQTNRKDATLYTIMAYITLFRLEELQVEDYRRLIGSQDAVKMHVFMQFIFDAEALRRHCREEWIKLYDYTYIDDKIIGSIDRNLPNVAEILGHVEKKATGHIVSTLT
jgi:hypothetical protein